MASIKIDNPELATIVKLSQDLFEAKNGFRPNTLQMVQIVMEKHLDSNSVKCKEWIDVLEHSEPRLFDVESTEESIVRMSKDISLDRDAFVPATIYHLSAKSPECPSESFYLVEKDRDVVNEFIKARPSRPLRLILCLWIQGSWVEVMEDTDENRLFLHISQAYDPEKLNAVDKRLGRVLPERVTVPSCRKDETGKEVKQVITWETRTGRFEVRDIETDKVWMSGQTWRRGLAEMNTEEDARPLGS